MSKTRVILLWIFFFSVNHSSAQTSESFNDLKKYIQTQKKLNLDSSEFLSIYHNKELHYLYPIYKSFTQESTLIGSSNAMQYHADLSQAISFSGDYATVLATEKMSYDSKLTDSLKKIISKQTDLLTGIEFRDAKKYILERARHQKVVMINEAHNKPLHRAFTASLLEDLYALGFRYFAMEALNQFPNASLKQVNILTGHYTCEPMAGELVRKAISIGFTLVAYDDSAYLHTTNQRSYAEADNINQVLKKDPTAKILVYTGYANNEEGATSDDRIPMAAYFKIISGIDPLTIDQSELTEQSTSEYGSAIYDQINQKFSFSTPVVPLKNSRPKDLFDLNLYDIYIMHPVTKYRNGRAIWNSMNGTKKETPVQPIYQSLFMIQAFYDKEYIEKQVGKLVPADQTYITAQDGYYYLYLQKGRYQIVYRDMQYKILGNKVLVVE